MLLIIGGEGSGKRSFARNLGYTDDMMADGILDGSPVIFHLEEMVFRAPERAEELLPALLQKELVICCEVGSGVIPVLRQERLGREAVGRLCVLLAKEADCVVRTVCGFPTVIKGELPCV